MNIKIILQIISCLFLSACGTKEEIKKVPLVVEVLDDIQKPVEAAVVTVDSKEMPKTDKAGRVETSVSGPRHRKISVEVVCPKGHEIFGSSKEIILISYLKPVLATDDELAAIKVGFTCVPDVREHVLLVRTNIKKQLPVLVMGEKKAVINDDGVVHIVMKGKPKEEIIVSLDTSEFKDLRPRMPKRRIIFPSTSQILVFDQEFKVKKKRRRKKRARIKRIPVRL